MDDKMPAACVCGHSASIHNRDGSCRSEYAHVEVYEVKGQFHPDGTPLMGVDRVACTCVQFVFVDMEAVP